MDAEVIKQKNKALCHEDEQKLFVLIKDDQACETEIPDRYNLHYKPTKASFVAGKIYSSKTDKDWLDTGLAIKYNVGIRGDFLDTTGQTKYFSQMPFWMINAHLQGVDIDDPVNPGVISKLVYYSPSCEVYENRKYEVKYEFDVDNLRVNKYIACLNAQGRKGEDEFVSSLPAGISGKLIYSLDGDKIENKYKVLAPLTADLSTVLTAECNLKPCQTLMPIVLGSIGRDNTSKCQVSDNKLYAAIDNKQVKRFILPTLRTIKGSVWEYSEADDICLDTVKTDCTFNSGSTFKPSNLIKGVGSALENNLKENYLYATKDCLLAVTVPMKEGNSLKLSQVLPDPSANPDSATELQNLGGITGEVKYSSNSKTIFETDPQTSDNTGGIDLVLKHLEADKNKCNVSGLKKFETGLGIQVAPVSSGVFKFAKDEGLYLNLYKKGGNPNSGLQQLTDGLKLQLDEATVGLTADNRVEVLECGKLTPNYLTQKSNHNTRKIFKGVDMQLTSFNTNIVVLSFPIIFTVSNDCNKKMRAIVNMHATSSFTLASHQVALMMECVPVDGVEAYTANAPICYDSAIIPFENANGSWNSSHPQYIPIGRTALASSNFIIVSGNPNTGVQFNAQVTIAAPTGVNLNTIKVAGAYENGGVPIKEWISSMSVEISADFKTDQGAVLTTNPNSPTAPATNTVPAGTIPTGDINVLTLP